MKKLIDLYRKYGVSQAALRQLASAMQPEGRAEKKKHRGKNIWYLQEQAVLEYLAGKHRTKTLIDRPLDTKKQEIQNQLQALQKDKQQLKEKISRQKVESRKEISALRISNKTMRRREARRRKRSNIQHFSRLSLEKRILRQSESLKHDYVVINGIRLHYVSQGKGPLMILLHGFPEFWYSWRYQLPEMARGYRVVAPDMRGYNLSDKPKKVGDYHLDLLTSDVKELMAALGYEKAIIVGHDWGGAVAWKFALRYPHSTDKLIVLNCPHPNVFAHHIKNNLRQLLRSWYMFCFQIPWLPELLIKLAPDRFIRQVFYHGSPRKDAFTAKVLNHYREVMLQPGALTASMNYYRAAFRSWLRVSRDKSPITAPTLLIWGEEDQALGKELTYNMEKYFADKFKVNYVPNCGHNVQQQEPKLVNQYILQFLKENEYGR